MKLWKLLVNEKKHARSFLENKSRCQMSLWFKHWILPCTQYLVFSRLIWKQGLKILELVEPYPGSEDWVRRPEKVTQQCWCENSQVLPSRVVPASAMKTSSFFSNRWVFIITEQKGNGGKVGNEPGVLFPANCKALQSDEWHTSLCRVDSKNLVTQGKSLSSPPVPQF